MSIGDCSNNNFFGNASKKGELDVLLALLELKDHLLYEYIPSLALEATVTKALRVLDVPDHILDTRCKKGIPNNTHAIETHIGGSADAL